MTEELNNNEDNQFLVKENDRSSVYQVEIGQLLKVTKQWKKQKNRNVSLRNSKEFYHLERNATSKDSKS